MSNQADLLLNKPSALNEHEFIQHYKDIYEHSSWVANAAWQHIQRCPRVADFDRRSALQALLYEIVESRDYEVKLALLRSHPDLAGKAALSGELTPSSTSEQAGVGLDQCTPAELARFTEYNNAYKAAFDFPFIMAVKGATKAQVLSAFESRINNNASQEFQTAMSQVHKIAAFRLAEK
ncbi:2-oxo-4-hydroxy-4-carboxy-5-ureidoimidazoline decarboxylase [Marinomonas arenicola]|uniref:2-oxo-4-hydroxy-4-carboxy-5-ureidoimidazoline decarboxylase n=1 Tax=Marinomonas arenicola TaxID=569601 RepID=UPI00311F8397